ncbi:MAG: nitroreductase family protein [Thaumarchaeota archaeon]|nr:nitroreductase family protein [Nitrososphaerota archaeon]
MAARTNPSANQHDLDDLVFFKMGAMSFQEKEIPPEVLRDILRASTSSAWLGRWRLLCVTGEDQRIKVVQVWQDALRKMGRIKDVEFIERWKVAPLFVAFCQPKDFQPFQWVSAEYARIYGIQEVGAAVRSIELKGLQHGIGLHGIMGLVVPEVNGGVKAMLDIPEDHDIVFFGIMGYPKEEVENTFPKLRDVSFSEKWANPLQLD